MMVGLGHLSYRLAYLQLVIDSAGRNLCFCPLFDSNFLTPLILIRNWTVFYSPTLLYFCPSKYWINHIINLKKPGNLIFRLEAASQVMSWTQKIYEIEGDTYF